jgi:hypothetical protein
MIQFFKGYRGREIIKVTVGKKSDKYTASIEPYGSVTPSDIEKIIKSYLPTAATPTDYSTKTGYTATERM